jgi:hypothetical protein
MEGVMEVESSQLTEESHKLNIPSGMLHNENTT